MEVPILRSSFFFCPAFVSRLQTEANRVIAHMLGFEVIPYEKEILYLQKVIRCPAVRQPLKRFTSAERARIEAFYRESSLLRCDRGQ